MLLGETVEFNPVEIGARCDCVLGYVDRFDGASIQPPDEVTKDVRIILWHSDSLLDNFFEPGCKHLLKVWDLCAKPLLLDVKMLHLWAHEDVQGLKSQGTRYSQTLCCHKTYVDTYSL